jgi:hypothetical protein
LQEKKKQMSDVEVEVEVEAKAEAEAEAEVKAEAEVEVEVEVEVEAEVEESKVKESEESDGEDSRECMKFMRTKMQNEIDNIQKKRKRSSKNIQLKQKKKKLTKITKKENNKKKKKILKMKQKKGDVWFYKKDAKCSSVLTKYKMERKNATELRLAATSKKMNLKITNYMKKFNGIFLKPGCDLYKIENSECFIVGIKCVTCKNNHPRTLQFFNSHCSMKELEASQPAHERLHNSTQVPCRNNCETPKTQEQYIRKRLQPYKITAKQIEAKMAKQKGVGLISGVKISFDKDQPFQICRYVNHKKDEKSKYESHCDDNVYLDIVAMNPQQHKHIKCMTLVYSVLADTIRDPYVLNVDIFKTMHFTTAQSGVTASCVTNRKEYNAQIEFFHLPSIIYKMVGNHINKDFKANRILATNLGNTDINVRKKIAEKIIAKIIEQKGKCALHGYDLTVVNGPLRFSCDRIDDLKAHFLGEDCLDLSNIQMVGRIFNTEVKQTPEQHNATIDRIRILPEDATGKRIFI